MTGQTQDVGAFLSRLAELGIEVQAQGERLLCRGARRLVTREIQAELVSRKHDILEHLRMSATPEVDAPLSYAQQRLWFLDQMQPGSAAYTLSMAQHLRGELDTRALCSSLTELTRRHEILRSNFPLVEGEPVQRVQPVFEVDLATVDLTGVPASGRDAELHRLVRAEFARPFNLASDRLLRASVYRLDNQSQVLTLAAHHMIADGWSVALIGRELAALYAAAASGAPLPVSGPVTQYANYAHWQRDALAGEALTAELSYWSAELRTAPRVLALPADRARPPLPSFRSGRVEFQVDVALTSVLREISRGAGASLFMLLLAAEAVLLARHARQTQVVIGTPIAGRNRTEWAEIIGCFVNTLALRVDLGGDPTFMELLARVRETALDAFDHQDLPFERVVESLRPDRDLSRNPLVQVSLGLHNAPGQTPLATFALPGLAATPIDIDPGTVRFDLELDLWEVSGGLHGRLLYASDLFDQSTAERMAAEFRTLLGEIAANPQLSVSRLALMTAIERREVLTRWNPEVAPVRSEQLLHDIVYEQAARTPDAVALVCGDTKLSYAELMARAQAQALIIRHAGVKPGDVVGLCVARGAAAVIAMLGILECEAAYVPIDPEHPPARATLVLGDCGAKVMVTEPQFHERFSGDAIFIVHVGLDEIPAVSVNVDAEHTSITAESLAYVMYTSGSTGRPKGVAVPHRAVVGLLEAMQRVLPLGPGDVFLALTTFAFDISVLELFLPLTRGAQLLIADREQALDSKRLAAAIAQRGVTAMQATPATWSMLVDSGWEGAPTMSALCGGEALAPTLAAALHARCAQVWNVYGPTETTIWSSFDKVRRDAPVSIGHALANNSLYLLDPLLEPLPPGMVGEIWIGGEGVSHGYFRRPGLTAGAFLPDPFATRAGARMYRTGDLGRRREDGRIECLGRIDHQLKFRGFRIEPGDIEAALLEHHTVAQAVVCLFGVAPAEQRLVAYVVASPGQVPGVPDLRQHLLDCLPAYLVPTHFVLLDALPATPNGKIDRMALPAPSRSASPAETHSTPLTELERSLADIWAGVLLLDRVGVEDSFFDLGGHSLLLAKVRMEIAQRLGREVSVMDLFRWPTIRALARQLSGTAVQDSSADAAESTARQVMALERLAQAAKQARTRNG